MTGEQIRHIRESYGLSREQFARAFGVSSQTILYWEKGTHTPSGVHDILLNGLASKLGHPEEMEGMRQALLQAQYMPPDFSSQQKARGHTSPNRQPVPDPQADFGKVLLGIGLGVLLVELLKGGNK